MGASLPALKDKPAIIRDMAETADELMFVLEKGEQDGVLDAPAPMLMKIVRSFAFEDDPDLVQLGYCLFLDAVLTVPPATAGEMLHNAARFLRAELSAGMPSLVYGPHPAPVAADAA